MDLQKFNFLILSTQGRVKTMSSMLLEHSQKMDLAKTGLFFHNNLIKCIGCHMTMDKIDARRAKHHTYSGSCISATNALLSNETLRRQSFDSFKWARRQFKSKIRVVDMLSRSGFYCFNKPSRIRCAECKVVTAYVSVDDAQNKHDSMCKFRYMVNIDLDGCTKIDLPPPQLQPKLDTTLSFKATAPPDTSLLECKVCFENEKSVCFLPCRHLVVCTECSPRCKRCCVCNSKITSRIETLPQ